MDTKGTMVTMYGFPLGKAQTNFWEHCQRLRTLPKRTDTNKVKTNNHGKTPFTTMYPMDSMDSMAHRVKISLGKTQTNFWEHCQRLRTLPQSTAKTKPTAKEKLHSPVRCASLTQGVPPQCYPMDSMESSLCKEWGQFLGLPVKEIT